MGNHSSTEDGIPRGSPGNLPFDPVDFTLSNIVLISSGVVATLFAINLLATSNGSPNTALGLLASSGPGTVLTAMLVLFVVVYLPIAIVVLMVFDSRTFGRISDSALRFQLRLFTYLTLALIAVIVSPALTVGYAILIAIVTKFRERKALLRPAIRQVARGPDGNSPSPAMLHPKSEGSSSGQRMARSLMFGVIVPLVLFLILGGMWLPRENIELPGKQYVVGYILSTDNDWATVLLDRDKELRRIHASDIKSRQLCSKGWGWNQTTIAGIAHYRKGPDYPKCKNT